MYLADEPNTRFQYCDFMCLEIMALPLIGLKRILKIIPGSGNCIWGFIFD